MKISITERFRTEDQFNSILNHVISIMRTTRNSNGLGEVTLSIEFYPDQYNVRLPDDGLVQNEGIR